MNCPTPDFTANPTTDSRQTAQSSFVLFRPLAWLVAHKAFCVFLLLLGLVGLGALNQNLLADAYLAAASNPHEETAKIFPADTTLMYVSVTNIGALLREDEKIGEIIEAEVGDLGDFEKTAQESLDEGMEEIFGQKIRTKEDLQALGLLNGSMAFGVCVSGNKFPVAVAVLTSDEAEKLAGKIADARKRAFEERKKMIETWFKEDIEEGEIAPTISVTQKTIEYKGCEITVVEYREPNDDWPHDRCFVVCVMGNNVVCVLDDGFLSDEKVPLIKHVIDVRKDGGKSLYDDAEFRDCMDRLSSDRLASCYFAAEPFFRWLTEMNKGHEDFMSYLGDHIGSTFGEVVAKDGAIVVNACSKLPEASPVDKILSDRQLHGERFLFNAPLIYAEVNCDIEQAWKTLHGITDRLGERDKEDVDEFFQRLFDKKAGDDLGRDFVAAFEARGFFALYDLPVIYAESGTFDILYGFKIKDPQKAQQLVDTLLKTQKPEKATLSKDKIGQYEITELKLNSKTSVIWMTIGDCVLATNNRECLKRVIDVYEGKEKAFVPPVDKGICAWMDSRQMLERILDMVISYTELEWRVYQERHNRALEEVMEMPEEHRKEEIENMETSWKREETKTKENLATCKGIRKIAPLLNPLVVSAGVENDMLVVRVQTGIGKGAATSESASGLAHTCANVSVALFVVVLGVCCFVPRRLAA